LLTTTTNLVLLKTSATQQINLTKMWKQPNKVLFSIKIQPTTNSKLIGQQNQNLSNSFTLLAGIRRL